MDLPAVVEALAVAGGKRLNTTATLIRRLSQGTPVGVAVPEALDRNEAHLDELVTSWRRAGVRWPITILALTSFAAGLMIGRRMAGR